MLNNSKLFGLLVICLAIACTSEQQPPTPILPLGNSCSIRDTSLVFTWHPVADAKLYAIEISKHSDFRDFVFSSATIEDTFQLLSSNKLKRDSTYYWRISAYNKNTGWGLWSNVTSFFSPLNLNTTYFPFGLDYEWCYERSADGDDANIYPPATWKYCDTFILVVTDSFWKDDTLCFKMQTKGKPKAFPRGYPRNWFRTPKGFDVTNFARIIGNKIVFDSYLMIYLEDYTVKLIPDEYKECYSLVCFSISYSSDSTLDIFYSTTPSLGLTSNDELPSYRDDIRVSRLKGIGTYSQYNYISDQTSIWYEIRDRLLWFYNGRDTVFKAKFK